MRGKRKLPLRPHAPSLQSLRLVELHTLCGENVRRTHSQRKVVAVFGGPAT